MNRDNHENQPPMPGTPGPEGGHRPGPGPRPGHKYDDRDRKHKHGHDHDDEHEMTPEERKKAKEKRRKKRRRRIFLLILLLILIIGVLLGILLDRGIGLKGGEGWISGLFEQDEKKDNQNSDDNQTSVTPAPTAEPSNSPEPSVTKAYVKVNGSKVFFNDVEVTVDDVIAQLNTDTYKDAEVILIDEYAATKAVWDELKEKIQKTGNKLIIEGE